MMDLCDVFATTLSFCGLLVPLDISGASIGIDSAVLLSESFHKVIGHSKAYCSAGFKYYIGIKKIPGAV